MKFKEKSVLMLIILIGIVFLFSSSASAADSTKVLVTQTSTGGYENSQSTNPSVSADGNYVAFESYSTNLGSGSSGKGVQDIYVYSYKTNKTEWITHTPTGKAANGNSYTPSISNDGRYVTFASTATNLGPGGSGNGIKDIYLYDRKFKIMKWITHSPTGGSASNSSNNPVISADGTTIAFQSTAKNLGTGGSEYYVSDIYLYDTTSNASNNYPQWITHTVRGYTANGASINPTINENGRYIAFESAATNLGQYDYINTGSGKKAIFLYDRDFGTIQWVTYLAPEIEASIHGGPFTSSMPVNLTMNESGTIYWSFDNSSWNVYDSANPPEITTTTYLYFYGITADFRKTNLVSEFFFTPDSERATVWASPSSGTYYNTINVTLNMDLPGTIYYSLNGGNYTTYTNPFTISQTTILRFYGIDSVNDKRSINDGYETYTMLFAPIEGINPAISADGSRITYQSGTLEIDDLVYEYAKIYLFDRNTGMNYLITEQRTGGDPNGISANPSISGNGRYIAFESTAYNLGYDPEQPYGSNMPGVVFYDNSFRRDIFVYDLDRIFNPTPFNQVFYLNWITHDTIYGPANGNSYTPSLNEDGTMLAYSSSANNLGPGGNGVYRDIFLEDSGLVVKTDKESGTYNSPLTVNLTLVNDSDSSGTIYYTTDGSDPKSGLTYVGPITITSNTLLRYIGYNSTGWTNYYSQNYIIRQPPTVTANPVGGTYTSAKKVTLTTVDPDSTAKTYYTTDGTDPKTSTTRKIYKNPIMADTTTTLRYIAVDPNGNWSPNYTQTYTINLPSNAVTMAQLNAAAANVKNYYENHSKTLPVSATINGQTYTMSQMLYLLVTATINMSNSNLYPIIVKTVNAATSPSGTIKSGNIQKSGYITYAKSIKNYINSNNKAPNYVATTLGHMKLKYMVYMYSKIVNYYNSNSRLPSYVSITK